MIRALASTYLLAGILMAAACGGDDTVNPSNPDASPSVAKDGSSDSHPKDATSDSGESANAG